LVQNVETLSHLAMIHRGGADWFRSVGTSGMPGTTLITLSGDVLRGGVYEVKVGVPFAELLRSAGGPTAEIGAVLVGGYSGTWLAPEEAAGATLDREGLARVGGNLGCGAIVVLPTTACGLQETAATMTWMARQTAGQCGPCVFGLEAIAALSEELRDGRANKGAVARLSRWADDIEGRGACRYPDGAVRLMRSALKTFERDANEHSLGRRCAGTNRPLTLPLPEIRGAA
jgi:NADH:ubiquinone oxidoreductase subunit F (NADH-binding)